MCPGKGYRRLRTQQSRVLPCEGPAEFVENSHLTGTNTANRGRSRFKFYGAINIREPITNLPVMGTDIACANRVQKRGNPLQVCISQERIPQIADAAELHFMMQYTTHGNNSRVTKANIARIDGGQKRGNPL
uniref:Uncharacterized protein n=1 Tax=Ixodes ricinus TaxID=34613 RepID=A0A6B0URG8_IXORI